jgi:hypothetical protein
MQYFLKSNYFCDLLEAGKIRVVLVNRFAPFSFYLTGGINQPSSFSGNTIEKLMAFENKLPSSISKFLGTRQVVAIQKCL